jgi:hypothetical protein
LKRGVHGGEVEHGAHGGAAAADAAHAPDLPAVAYEGATPTSEAISRRPGEQCARDARPDLVDPPIECADLLPEHAEHGLDRAAHGGRGRLSSALLGHDHRDELPATGDEVGQETGSALQDRANRRLDLFAEEREEPCVEGVRLGEDPHALAEAANPARVHDDDREPGLGELGHERALVAARRLDDDACGIERDELADELRDPSRLVASVLDLAFGTDAPLVLGDIDSDRLGHGKLLRSNELGLSNTGSRRRPKAHHESSCS